MSAAVKLEQMESFGFLSDKRTFSLNLNVQALLLLSHVILLSMTKDVH